MGVDFEGPREGLRSPETKAEAGAGEGLASSGELTTATFRVGSAWLVVGIVYDLSGERLLGRGGPSLSHLAAFIL